MAAEEGGGPHRSAARSAQDCGPSHPRKPRAPQRSRHPARHPSKPRNPTLSAAAGLAAGPFEPSIVDNALNTSLPAHHLYHRALPSFPYSGQAVLSTEFLDRTQIKAICAPQASEIAFRTQDDRF